MESKILGILIEKMIILHFLYFIYIIFTVFIITAIKYCIEFDYKYFYFDVLIFQKITTKTTDDTK